MPALVWTENNLRTEFFKNDCVMIITWLTVTLNSGGSRGGPPPPLFWIKKEPMTEGKRASRAHSPLPPSPPPLAQALDLPLLKGALKRFNNPACCERKTFIS